MIQAITQGIEISVKPQFCGIQNHNNKEYFLFDYSISIKNQSSDTVQLHSKHWEIFDSLNEKETSQGEGLFGKKPILSSGETHSFVSYCPLKSNCGSMKGFFTMINLETQSTFEVEIPTFQMQTDFFSN